MASFGQYQTVHELYNIGFTALYSAHTANSTEELFAIKAFQPSLLLVDEKQAKIETILFLNSAKVQQKLSASDAQYWAPIHEFGLISNGAFYVTDKYNRSLQQLISGRVRLNTQLLHTIIQSVAKGLLELKKACSRPHGNLKASNILIADAENILQTKTVLTDPLPDRHIDTQVHWNTDLRAIAEFIYQLVMQRQSPATRGWQAPDSQEWTTLGKHANDWRNLCNKLMNAYAKSDSMNIEILLEELENIKETRSHKTLKYIGIFSLVLLAVIVVILFCKPKKASPTIENWKTLCDEYLIWIGPLKRKLKYQIVVGDNHISHPKKNNQYYDEWKKNQDLIKLLNEEINTASYPYRIAQIIRAQVNDKKIKRPKDQAAMDELKATDTETTKALMAIENIVCFFNYNSENSWPLLHTIDETTKKLKERKWDSASDIEKWFNPSDWQPDEIADRTYEVLTSRQLDVINNINSFLMKIKESEQTLKDERDPILKQFNDSFVDRQIARIADAKTVIDKLENIADIGADLARFVKSNDWNNTDKKLFINNSNVHKNSKNIDIKSLTDWQKEVKEYSKLLTDPRKKLYEHVNIVKENIELAIKDNKNDGEKIYKIFEQYEKDITKLKEIDGIKKNQNLIDDKISGLKKIFDDIYGKAQSLMIDPDKWCASMAERTTVATSNNIKKEWERRRNKLLDEYNISSFKNNNYHTAFQKLRNNVKETLNRLEALDKVSQPGFSKELTAPTWNIKRTGLYYVKKEKLFKDIISEMPETHPDDPNSDKFERQWGKRIKELQVWKRELTKIIWAFNEIEKALDNCYLLNDTLPDSNTIGELYGSWKGKEIFKEEGIASAIKEVTERVKKIIEIENNSGKRVYLENTAIALTAKPEARYAAWTKLDQLSTWPIQTKDREKEELIQSKLKKYFKAISKTNHTRGKDLLTKLAKSNIERFKKTVANNTNQDKILSSFENFQPYGPNNDLDQIVEHETLAKNLAEFVESRQWKEYQSKIEIRMFEREKRKLYRMNTSELKSQHYNEWLDIKKYVKLENDPRQKYNKQDTNNINNKARYVMGLITNHLRLAKFKETREFEADINNITETTTKIFDKAAIEKYKEEIKNDVSLLNNLWQELEKIEKDIKSVIKPIYCKNVILLGEKEIKQVVFAPTVTLNTNFVPVNRKSDGSFGTLKIEKWDKFKNSVELGKNFFEKTKGDDDDLNIGWPKYIRSTKDPTVILKFIPKGIGNPEPFYMATHEITNKQYVVFMLQNNVTRLAPTGWEMPFISPEGQQIRVIRASTKAEPPCRIKWNNSQKKYSVSNDYKDVPVTYVPFKGAQSYAKWLEGQLPTAKQHEYASRAGTTTTYPWGNDPQKNPNQAHVRASAWKNKALKYNENISNLPLTQGIPQPLGAVKDSPPNRPLNVTDYVTNLEDKTTYRSVWPAASNSYANKWGLYDLIGNVWEWCKEELNDTPVICGGSCLSPPEYTKAGSMLEMKPIARKNNVEWRIIVPANDVGFRFIVPTRIKQTKTPEKP